MFSLQGSEKHGMNRARKGRVLACSEVCLKGNQVIITLCIHLAFHISNAHELQQLHRGLRVLLRKVPSLFFSAVVLFLSEHLTTGIRWAESISGVEIVTSVQIGSPTSPRFLLHSLQSSPFARPYKLQLPQGLQSGNIPLKLPPPLPPRGKTDN